MDESSKIKIHQDLVVVLLLDLSQLLDEWELGLEPFGIGSKESLRNSVRIHLGLVISECKHFILNPLDHLMIFLREYTGEVNLRVLRCSRG